MLDHVHRREGVPAADRTDVIESEEAMPDIRESVRGLIRFATLALAAQSCLAVGVDPDDQKLIDAASCEEIVKQHGIHVAQEKAVAEEIRRTNSGTVATNVVGVATLAAFGFGFFTWDNSVDAEHNLAELRAYREAIAKAGRDKGCKLSAQ